MKGIRRTTNREPSAGYNGFRLPSIGKAGNYDPFFANVALLLQPQAGDGSTAFIDRSLNGATLTATSANGTAQVTSDYTIGGLPSVRLANVGDYIVGPTNSTTAFGNTATNNGTVEAWLRLVSLPDAAAIWDSTPNGGLGNRNNSFVLYIQADGSVAVFTNNANRVASAAGAMSLDILHHVAVCFDNGNMRLYLNGVQVSQSTFTFNDGEGGKVIGKFADISGGPYVLNGNFVLRVTKGVARYRNGTTFSPELPFLIN